MDERTDFLQKIHQALVNDDDWDAAAELSAGTDMIPYNHIYVQFNSDSEIDTHVLILSILDRGPIQQSFGLEKVGDLLQAVSPFPYEVPEDKAAEVTRLLILLNKFLVIGHFGYDQQEKRCFFRFTYPLKPKQSVDYVTVVVRLVCEVINTYAPTIEQVSAGIVTVDELLRRQDSGI